MAQRGCAESFGELVGRCAPGLLAFLHHRTGSLDDAEDLVQDTFVRAYLKLHLFDGRARFTTWLYTIARNLATDRCRKRPPLSMSHAELVSPQPGPEEILERSQLRTNLWSVARTLPVAQYEALWLRYAQDMPVKDIARVMSRTGVGVKVLLHRARINMAKKLRRRRILPVGPDRVDGRTGDGIHKGSGA